MKNKFLLRVHSGTFKGKGLFSPPDATVRPTSARVKDSLFNIIRTKLYGADFLDIFCGTGQIGIEAISNGANATFIDKNTSIVSKNLQNICLENKSRLIQGDFKNVLSSFAKNNEFFDFVFADPPYNEGLYEDIINYAMPLLKDDGVLILEHSSDLILEDLFQINIIDKRSYGSRSLTFLGGKQ